MDEAIIQLAIQLIPSILKLAQEIEADLAKNNITLDDIKALADRVPEPDTFEEDKQ
jgi:hypothetical protein